MLDENQRRADTTTVMNLLYGDREKVQHGELSKAVRNYAALVP